MSSDDEYRHRRDSARRDRQDDLDDLCRVLAGGGIDSPEKRARANRMHDDFDAAKRELNIQLHDASSVGAVATAALEQAPKEFVYLRVKEGPGELIPRCGSLSKSFTTYLDLAESALRSSLAESWGRLRSYPMVIVEAFSDHHETQQSLVVVAIGTRQRCNQTIAVGRARAVAFPKFQRSSSLTIPRRDRRGRATRLTKRIVIVNLIYFRGRPGRVFDFCTGACASANVKKFVRLTVTVLPMPTPPRHSAADVLMAAARSDSA